MTPIARAAAAIEVLADVAARNRPAVDALKDWGLSHRFAGSGDRVAIGNLVLDALRQRSSLGWRMGSDEPRALVLAAMRWMWATPLAAIEDGIAGDRHPPAPLDDAERAALAAEPAEAMPEFVAADLPERFRTSLERSFGDRLVVEGRAMAERAPVDLRANTLKSDRDAVLKALAAFKAEPARFSPVGIRLPVGAGAAKPPHVQSEEGYVKGRFEIQDEGSQLAALMAGARPGDQVLDLCAGGGGKTLALAAEMGNRGQIHAYDSDRRRFGDIVERLRRAGVRNAQVHRPGGEGVLDDLAGRMRVVLVDAPCTGSGTWRRRPDAKWRLAEGALAQRVVEQAALLADAVRFVAPGGRLVYVTCSIFPEENEDQVAAFLAHHPEFRLADPAGDWLAAIGSALPPGFTTEVPGFGRALRLTPATAATDGFFVATLERGAG